jgi:hypothetical protein
MHTLSTPSPCAVVQSFSFVRHSNRLLMAKINIQSWCAHSYTSICKGVALPRSFSNRKKEYIGLRRGRLCPPYVSKSQNISPIGSCPGISQTVLVMLRSCTMRRGHESRPYNADNAEQQASSPQGPEVTCEGMSFGFRIRGPPEEQAHLVLHAFVSVAIMDRGMYSCGFTLLCALHRPRPRRLRPSHPLTFLCASQQFYGSWLQVPRAGCGLVELSPFVRRVRDKLRLLIERDNHALSEPQSGLLELNCSSIPV